MQMLFLACAAPNAHGASAASRIRQFPSRAPYPSPRFKPLQHPVPLEESLEYSGHLPLLGRLVRCFLGIQQSGQYIRLHTAHALDDGHILFGILFA